MSNIVTSPTTGATETNHKYAIIDGKYVANKPNQLRTAAFALAADLGGVVNKVHGGSNGIATVFSKYGAVNVYPDARTAGVQRPAEFVPDNVNQASLIASVITVS